MLYCKKEEGMNSNPKEPHYFPFFLPRKMKCDLQELRRKGAKSYTRQYGERTCARCQRSLGKFLNTGAVCRGCSHRICSRCRVGASDWKCTVCHAYRWEVLPPWWNAWAVRIKAGQESQCVNSRLLLNAITDTFTLNWLTRHFLTLWLCGKWLLVSNVDLQW